MSCHSPAVLRVYVWVVEESFRDVKDLRFGMGLSSFRIAETDRRDRLLLLSALTCALLTLLGAAGETEPSPHFDEAQ